MAGAHAVVWALASRWERPGRDAQLSARITPPPLLAWGGNVAQVAPLVYPVLVAVAPSWGYEGWLNGSSSVDLVLQAVGIGIWGVGVAVLLWAAWTLGRYGDVTGLAVDHELITHGPYRYVRHPIYSSFAAIAVGTALFFCSYLLVAVAVTYLMAARWWAGVEEELLASPEGFGQTYCRYADRTGRFLPSMKGVRS